MDEYKDLFVFLYSFFGIILFLILLILKKQRDKISLTAVLFCFYCSASLVLFLIAYSFNIVNSSFVLGQFIIVNALIKLRNTSLGYFWLLFGIFVLLLGCLSFNNIIIKIFGSCLGFIFVMQPEIINYLDRKLLIKNNGVEVEAICIRRVFFPRNTNHTASLYSVYEFYIGDNRYLARERVATPRVYKDIMTNIGEKIDILVNLDNPKQYYIPYYKQPFVIKLVLLFLVLIVSLILFFI